MIVFQPDRYLLRKFVRESVPLLTGDVLDVGGQDGRRYQSLLTSSDSYTCLDPGEEYKPDIVAVAENMPLETNSIDSMMCIEVLMDIYDTEAAIAEMARVLKPGGALVMTVSFMGPLCDEPYHFWRFTPYSFEKLLEKDFTGITVEARGGYRSQRAQNWIRYWIERLDLYKRPLLGRIFSVVSSVVGKRAIRRDARDLSDANRKYAIGWNVTARKKES